MRLCSSPCVACVVGGVQARRLIDELFVDTGNILLQGLPITTPEACALSLLCVRLYIPPFIVCMPTPTGAGANR
jgi:hypothetical protein